MASAAEDLRTSQKAAILLVALGRETASKVIRHLSEEEVERVTFEMVHLGMVDSTTRAMVVAEFRTILEAHEMISSGGAEYAEDVLAAALGEERAAEVIGRLIASLKVTPFEFTRTADPSQILTFIQDEHPQTQALILAYLTSEQAAAVLSELPPDAQSDVARRIATLDRTPPDVIRDVESVIERRMASLSTEDYGAAVGGVDTLVNILGRVDRTTEKTIFESLSETAPELAEEVRNRMFVFEDIVQLDNRTIQQVLTEIEMNDLALALKGSTQEVAELVFANISSRAQERIKEDMEFLGPVRVAQVQEAQQRIVNVIRRLEDAGEIMLSRGGDDELVV
jgi:flagellar motor switch protein FliG